MNNPPKPGCFAATPEVTRFLLDAVARYQYVITSYDPSGAPLGIFIDGGIPKTMVISGCGRNLVQWQIEAQSEHTPHLIPNETYNVLRQGSLNQDGSIAYQGRNYQIRARWVGAHSIAEAIVV